MATTEKPEQSDEERRLGVVNQGDYCNQQTMLERINRQLARVIELMESKPKE